MRCLVTGGNGFLGSAIVRMLCARGDKVSVYCRSDAEHVAPFAARIIRGDIRDAAAVRSACDGADVVYHVAALTGIWGPKRDFFSINVEGTRNVIAACRAMGVGKLVYTSSPSVVFGREALCGVDESTPYPKRYLASYPESKAAAERMVLEANDRTLATVALRPHLIWGPGDPHLIPRVVERARRRKLMQVGDGTNLVDITYIDNAAEAQVLAAAALSPGSACAGRPYFVSQGEPVVLWKWLDGILKAIGVAPVNRRIPARLGYAVGGIFEALYALFRMKEEPRMTRFLACQLAKSHYFDISAARRDFGYEPRVSTTDGVNALIDWLRHPASIAIG